jgi:FtsP/CotA-like multicopper oxidase with cupredoxin domain
MSSKDITLDQGKKATQPPARRPLLLFLGGGLLIFLVLALSLGLGLGLGLKHNESSSSSSSPSSSSTPSSPTTTPSLLPGTTGNGTAASLESWRLDTNREYVLNMTWDVAAPPQLRRYDLVITEGVGWPDGVVRNMLFVNGKFPGPVIEANRGDTLLINVTNGLSKNSTTVHWHGVYQNGTNWFDGTTGNYLRCFNIGYPTLN